MRLKPVLCPLCLQSLLQKNDDGITCTRCDFRVRDQNVTLLSLQQRLYKALSKHSRVCNATPIFARFHASHIQNGELSLVCAVCHCYDSIIY